MIEQNTLLILGAGASKPYEFPLGSELRWQILEKFQNQEICFHALEKNGYSEGDILKFHHALQRSGQKSVDAFLERRTDKYRYKFIEIGKIAIAMMLLPQETEQVLFDKGTTRNWYQLLYEQLLTQSFEDFGSNNLSVITFNYDRSLEHYLLTALQNDYGKNLEECAEQLKSIPIIHVHGKLGDLPGLGDDNVIEYDSRKRYKNIFGACEVGIRDQQLEIFYKLALQSSQSIKIIHEDIEKDKEFKKAHQLIKEAREIHFLGFGFHPMNLKRLDIKGRRSDSSRVCGIAYDCTAEQEETIRTLRFEQLSFFLKTDRDKVRKKDIYDYLKYHRTFT